MNQNFNDIFDGLKQENNAASKPNNNAHYRMYETQGHSRNFCLTWPNGKKRFANYAYLVDAKISEDKDMITIWYASRTLILKGVRLGLLFEDLLFNLPLEIIMIDPRYLATIDENTFAVTSIEFVENR